MKFFSIILVAQMFLATFAFSSNLFITWSAGGGFFFSADPDVGIVPTVGQSALAQLIWRPDNTPDFNGVDAANVNNVNFLAPGEVLLVDHFAENIGQPFGDYAWFDNAPAFSGANPGGGGGYIYARIFENSNPQVGDFYYVGNINAALDRNSGAVPPDTAQIYNLNRDSTFGDPIDGAFGFQVVPEPGTIAMLALGLMTLGGAAHKKRKAAVIEA